MDVTSITDGVNTLSVNRPEKTNKTHDHISTEGFDMYSVVINGFLSILFAKCFQRGVRLLRFSRF